MTQLADLSFTKQLPVRHVNDDVGVYLVNSKLLVAEEHRLGHHHRGPHVRPPNCDFRLPAPVPTIYTYYRQYFFLRRCEENGTQAAAIGGTAMSKVLARQATDPNVTASDLGSSMDHRKKLHPVSAAFRT
jgi:hypothetical protein